MKKTILLLAKNQWVIGIVGFLFILGCLPSLSVAGETGEYRYKKTYQNKDSEYTWSLEMKNDQVIVRSFGSGNSSTSFGTQKGNTLEWKLQEEVKGHDLHAVREGNLLKITGKEKGKLYRDTLALGGKPWFQDFFYSLRPFLQSSGNSISFWTLRFTDMDKLKPFELEATKQGEELVTLGGQQVLTQKIEIRIVGFMAYIWHDVLWYRKSDAQLVKYHSVHGFPGVAETVIELVGEPPR